MLLCPQSYSVSPSSEFFTDESLSRKVGIFLLTSAVHVLSRERSGEGQGARFRFGLTNGDMNLELAASSEQEVSDWAVMITRVARRQLGGESDDTVAATAAAIASAAIATAAPPNTPVRGGPLHPDQGRIDREAISDIQFDDDTQETPSKQSQLQQQTLLSPATLSNVTTVEDACNFDSRGDQEGDPPMMSFLDISGEVKGLFFKLNQGRSHDLPRLQLLLGLLESDPIFRRKHKQDREEWLAEVAEFQLKCFQEQRGFVPPDIFRCTLATLQGTGGLPAPLATRLFRNKALWLVRMSPEDIGRLSLEELSGANVVEPLLSMHENMATNWICFYFLFCGRAGRFNPVSCGLDVVELFALLHALPPCFSLDQGGQKHFWRLSLEAQVRHLHTKMNHGSLMPQERRHEAYSGQQPRFQADLAAHSFTDPPTC